MKKRPTPIGKKTKEQVGKITAPIVDNITGNKTFLKNIEIGNCISSFINNNLTIVMIE